MYTNDIYKYIFIAQLWYDMISFVYILQMIFINLYLFKCIFIAHIIMCNCMYDHAVTTIDSFSNFLH